MKQISSKDNKGLNHLAGDCFCTQKYGFPCKQLTDPFLSCAAGCSQTTWDDLQIRVSLFGQINLS